MKSMTAGTLDRVIRRGLEIALSGLLLIAVTIPSAQAVTSNELKGLLGIPENNKVYTASDGSIPKGNKPSETKPDYTVPGSKPSIGTIEEPDVDKYLEIGKKNKDIEKSKEIIEQTKSKIKERVDSGSTAYLISVTVDGLISETKRLTDIQSNKEYAMDSIEKPGTTTEGMEINPETQVKEGHTDNSNGEVYEYDEVIKNSFSSEQVKEITDLEYDIGTIGNNAGSVVSNYFQIVTPWGFTKKAEDEEYTTHKLLGMDMYANDGDEIVSQWNGLVVDIGTDNSKTMQYIKIYHGNSTYTVYSHVIVSDKIYIGSEVYQGQQIAKACDTSIWEPDKENHMFYQVRINGEFINPLTIYGTRAKDLYERWLTTSSDTNIIEKGEEYFNKKEVVYDNNAGDTTEKVVFPDFNKDS